MARPPLGIVLASFGALFFSLKAIFIKAAYVYGVDAETLLALRMAYSLPFFIAMAFTVNRRQPMSLSRADWRMLAIMGVLGYYLSSYLDLLGLQYISASLERLILFLYPTFVLFLSAAFLGKPFRCATLLPLALCYAGIVIAVATDMRSTQHQNSNILLGCSLVAASALFYALYLMLSGQVIASLGSTRVTAYATLVASTLGLVQFALLRPLSALVQPWQVHALGLCMAIFSTALPIWLVAEAIRRIGAGPASMVGSLGPIFTIFLAALVLGEQIEMMQLVGGALVILGVSLVSRLKG